MIDNQLFTSITLPIYNSTYIIGLVHVFLLRLSLSFAIVVALTVSILLVVFVPRLSSC